MSSGRDTGAGTAAIADVATALEACAAAFVKEHRLPGASVAVVHGDDLAWSTGIGLCDAAAGRTADDATLYRVASVTKTFTGTAIMQLRDEGRLDLDDPAVAHVPELSAAVGVSPIENVTIRRLLSHESGLMGDAPGTDWEGPTYQGSVTANLARASEIGVRVPPNTQQKYSNMGYQLLGEIVARVSGRPYAEYVREQILEPLGMSASGFPPLPDALRARMATGYTVRQFSDELSESVAAPDNQAEGGLISCVADLARWISFQVREGRRRAVGCAGAGGVDPGRDAPSPVSQRRPGLGAGVGDQLVRDSPRRCRLGAALRRYSRVQLERLLRPRAPGRCDRAGEHDGVGGGAVDAAGDDRPRGGCGVARTVRATTADAGGVSRPARVLRR